MRNYFSKEFKCEVHFCNLFNTSSETFEAAQWLPALKYLHLVKVNLKAIHKQVLLCSFIVGLLICLILILFQNTSGSLQLDVTDSNEVATGSSRKKVAKRTVERSDSDRSSRRKGKRIAPPDVTPDIAG